MWGGPPYCSFLSRPNLIETWLDHYLIGWLMLSILFMLTWLVLYICVLASVTQCAHLYRLYRRLLSIFMEHRLRRIEAFSPSKVGDRVFFCIAIMFARVHSVQWKRAVTFYRNLAVDKRQLPINSNQVDNVTKTTVISAAATNACDVGLINYRKFCIKHHFYCKPVKVAPSGREEPLKLTNLNRLVSNHRYRKQSHHVHYVQSWRVGKHWTETPQEVRIDISSDFRLPAKSITCLMLLLVKILCDAIRHPLQLVINFLC